MNGHSSTHVLMIAIIVHQIYPSRDFEDGLTFALRPCERFIDLFHCLGLSPLVVRVFSLADLFNQRCCHKTMQKSTQNNIVFEPEACMMDFLADPFGKYK